MGRFVRDWLLDWAAARPDDEAVVDAHGRWTYAQLESATRRIAVALYAAGVGEGILVATLLRDGAVAVATVHAARRLGAVLAPLNRRAVPAEIAFQVTACQAAFLIHDTDQAPVALTALADAPSATPLAIDGLLAGPDQPGDHAVLRDEVDLDAPATILFTSGTSGRPRGAVLTYGCHLASADAWNAFLRPLPGDRWLACLPLFHIAGLAIVLRASRWGVPLEVQHRFDPVAVRRALDGGVTHLSLVGPMLDRLLAVGSGWTVPNTLRAVLLGGGPISPTQVLRARELGYPVVPSYGLSETASGVAALPADAAVERCATVGPPLPGVELWIEADGRPALPGEAGEIVVRGPMVFGGYADLPDDTARVLRDGWLHTGDFGAIDVTGDLTIIDRREDLIVSGGENIYPSEVEAVLLGHPFVAEAAVVGRADLRWGRVPVAAIVLRPGADVSDRTLAAHCRRRLAGFKVPVAFRRLAGLPRAPSGELLRSPIRELLDEASP